MLIPCPKCGHPRPTEGIGDGEIAALIRERDRYREALERIEGHTNHNVAPNTPPPDPRWINAIATAALKGK